MSNGQTQNFRFYYLTGVNSRFTLGLMKSFNKPSDSGEECLDQVRISSRADPGLIAANGASIPQRGSSILSLNCCHQELHNELIIFFYSLCICFCSGRGV